MPLKIKASIVGILAGTVNGFLGAGGGMIIIPLFINWLKIDERKTFATSVFVILPMCMVSSAVYFIKGSLDFSLAFPYLLGGLGGGFLAGRIFKKIPLDFIRRAFGLLIIYGGIKSFF